VATEQKQQQEEEGAAAARIDECTGAARSIKGDHPACCTAIASPHVYAQ
jgi:hypothetical protein